MSDTDIAMRMTLDGSNFASGMQQVNSQLNDLGIRTNSATASLGPLGTLMGTLANPMTLAALAAGGLGAALASSVGVAAGFQQSMANVNSVLGGGQEQFEQLSAVAREAGASTIFSASQAADALYFMASAGMNAGQASAALKDTLNLAAAGNLDLAQASEIVTGTLAQFSLKAEDAGRVANVLAAGASATNSDVAQLGQAMQNAGPMAASLGMSIEETTAALGIFANSNIKGAEAGTALKSMLGSMLTATKEGSTALAEMGLTYDDINPSMHSYGEIMSTLNEKHMTASQSVKIFGKEMASNALVAVKGANDYDALTQKITGTDKAAEMAAIQTNTMQGSMKELSSAVEEAQIALGNTLIPALTNTIDFMTWGVTAATNFGKALYGWGESANTAAAGLGTWLAGTGWFGTDADAEKAAYVISDTYVESAAEGIKAGKEITADAIGENLGGDKAISAAEEAGVNAAEAWAKAQDNWWKSYGAGAQAGYAPVGTWDEKGTFTPTYDVAGRAMYRQSQSTTSYGPGEYGSTVSLQSKIPIRFSEIYNTSTPGASYELNIAGKSYKTSGFDLTRADALTSLLSEANQDLNTDIASLFGPEGEALISGAIDQVTYDARVKVQENLTVDLSTMFKDVIVDPEKYLESQLAKIGEEAGEALKDGIVTIQEQVTLRELIDAFAAAGGSASDAMIQAIIAGDWGRVAELGRQVGEAFKENLVGGMAIELPSMAELVKDPTKIMGNFEDILKFQSGYLIPALTRNMNEVKGLLEAGVDEGKIYDNYIKPLKSISDYMPGWLNELMSYYESGKLDLEDFLYVYEGYLNQLSDSTKQIDRQTESVKQQTIGYNQLQKAMEDCAECAISDFGAWQEAQEGLFAESYIGAGGESYLAWKAQQVQDIAATQQAMLAAGGAVLGKSYTESPLLSYQLDLDTSNADSKLKSFQQELKGPSAMDAELKTDAAEATKATLQASIEATRPTMEVQLETSAAVAAANALYSEISALSPVVYVQVVPLISAADIAAMISAEIGGSV